MVNWPPEKKFRFNNIRCWLLLLICGCTVYSTEIYEGSELLPNGHAPLNSSEAFKNIKCDTNSSRFVNLNFTMTYSISNESLSLNLTTKDGYVVHHQEAESKRMVEELFLLGTSFINSAITSVRGENLVTLKGSANDTTKAEFDIKEKKVVTEMDDIDGNNTCTTIVYGNVTGFQLVVDHSVDPDERDGLGLAPLHWAAMFGDTNVILKLLKMGSNINVQWTREMATPLHFAAIRGDKEVVKFLLDKGADIDAKDIEDMSVVDAAIYSNQSEIVKLLIELGANLTTENPAGRTPLHVAAERGNQDIIITLLDNGGNVNAKDQEGRTPLHVALEYYQRETVQLFVERGAEVNFPELTKLYGETRVNELLGTHTTLVE